MDWTHECEEGRGGKVGDVTIQDWQLASLA